MPLTFCPPFLGTVTFLPCQSYQGAPVSTASLRPTKHWKGEEE